MFDHTDPVDHVHRAIHQPGASVHQVLASLPVPPLRTIPTVTEQSAKAGQWVTYTAMVQDIWDAEIFVASSPDHKSGLLTENAAASVHAAAKLSERLPIYLVSLPGETAWVRDLKRRHHSPGNQSSSLQHQTSADTATAKRQREPDAEMGDTPMVDTPVVDASPHASRSCDKRSRSHADSHSPSNAGVGLNLPVHDQPDASAVVAKLYDNDQSPQVKINSIIQVVGILQEGLDLKTDADETDEFAVEFAARNPKNVKRVHVVSWRELKPWEVHPLTRHLGQAGLEAARKDLLGIAGGMREVLIRYLASALYGDVLAAEYLLLSLVSRPSRMENGAVLEKLSVNIVLPSTKDGMRATDVLGALRNILASVVEVPVNIAGLNSLDLFPKKDYTLNRLRAGVLQLAPGTCLFGNEWGLKDGRLAERGVKNVRALTSVSNRCIVPIDFEYYESEIAVDCCSVFVSRGGKSIIPTDAVVRVREEAGNMQLQSWETYDSELLRKMRLAMMLLREDGKFDISNEAASEVEQVYVEARRNGQAQDGQETLQKWLSVARCCARSFGESSLTAERWRHAVDLERTRLGREKK